MGEPTLTKNDGESIVLHQGFSYRFLHPLNDGTSVFTCIHNNCKGSIILKKRKRLEKNQKKYKFVNTKNGHKSEYCKEDPYFYKYPQKSTEMSIISENVEDYNDLLLFPEDQDLFEKIQTELRIISSKEEHNNTTVQTLIKSIFWKLYLKLEELQDKELENNVLLHKIKEKNEEIANKDIKLKNSEERIQTLIDTGNENEKTANSIIEDLRNEIIRLKRECKNDANTTTSQDFLSPLKTPQKQNKMLAEFKTPYDFTIKATNKANPHSDTLERGRQLQLSNSDDGLPTMEETSASNEDIYELSRITNEILNKKKKR